MNDFQKTENRPAFEESRIWLDIFIALALAPVAKSLLRHYKSSPKVNFVHFETCGQHDMVIRKVLNTTAFHLPTMPPFSIPLFYFRLF